MDQHGTAGASGESTDSVLIFEGINIQAFIKDGHLNRGLYVRQRRSELFFR